MDFHVDKRGYLFLNGFCAGKFEDIQKEIIENRKDLVDLYKVRAILNPDHSVRYIADWQSIVFFYYDQKENTNV